MSEKDRHFDFSRKKCETKQRESMKGYCGLQNQLIFSAGVVHLVPCNCANAKMVAEPSFSVKKQNGQPFSTSPNIIQEQDTGLH